MRVPTPVNACCMLWVCMLTCVSACGGMLTSVSVGCMPYMHADFGRCVLHAVCSCQCVCCVLCVCMLDPVSVCMPTSANACCMLCVCMLAHVSVCRV